MAIFEKLFNKLGFDMPDERFELLETESGEPSGESKRRRFAGKAAVSDEMVDNKGKMGSIYRSLDKNERLLRALFNSEINSDIIFRRFETGFGADALIVFMNGMADAVTVSDFIIRPLMNAAKACGANEKRILESAVQIGEAEESASTADIEAAILEGRTALFIDGRRNALLLETRGFEKRSVTTAENERIVRGPQEGFTESIRTNVTLVRRIVKTRDLIVSYRDAGGDNGTKLALLYRKGVTNPTLLFEIERRLERIDIGLVCSSGVIEQLIEDSPLSPFPQTLATERPDRVASFLMNGSAALISEGSPFALIMPATAAALLNSPEDVYMRRPLGTLMRIVRYIGVFISLILPGYFVAVAMYHQGLLSTEVLSTLIKSREMVFEPLPFEMILLLFVFQLIREAGMRVPGSVGQAIGVIGGLILGQAAVSANLASTVILIIVALAGLGNLCIPDYSTQIAASYFRFAFVIAAWLGGLLALSGVLVIFTAYMANLKSFGVPFLSPTAPKTFSKRPAILRGSIKNGARFDDWLNTGEEKWNGASEGKGAFRRKRA
ncbi:MAG: spore germination protein [Clostridia bacterium]|nr:spore germination protein [Clostridia bacterium]